MIKLVKISSLAALATVSLLAVQSANAQSVECSKKTGTIQTLKINRLSGDKGYGVTVRAGIATGFTDTGVKLENMPDVSLDGNISGSSNMGSMEDFEAMRDTKSDKIQVTGLKSEVEYRYALDDGKKHADQTARRIVTVTYKEGDFTSSEIFVDGDCSNLKAFNHERM